MDCIGQGLKRKARSLRGRGATTLSGGASCGWGEDLQRKARCEAGRQKFQRNNH